MESIITIIQTRRGSSRLPDKVLMPLQGKPLFVRQAERVKAARLCGRVIVATTTDAGDDPIGEVCRKEGLDCFRGDAQDLLDRHYQAALLYPARAVIKIPSDCPLIDPAVIDTVISFYLDHPGEYDFVSNLHPATWPDGNDVEIMTFSALGRAWREANRPLEREHTTPYFWERPDEFRIGNVVMEGGVDYSMSHRFTIDYAEDYAFIRAVYDELYPSNPFFGVADILALLERRPDIYAINSGYAGVNWYRHHLDELKTVSAEQTKQL
ncbi:MAG TPA: glycosyltransferase family protein [Puia sp.]|uniref:glycosyltransferase family protein n=1 Tax=Puia sp. TaxID=2045100 RepID=UPI002CBCDFDA|nr:glycosyltransferase family protein [Puia sp.]HVU98577.1 glycosyltransferase family protein [Puia sp.]